MFVDFLTRYTILSSQLYSLLSVKYTKYDIWCHLLFGDIHSYIFVSINVVFYQVKILIFF